MTPEKKAQIEDCVVRVRNARATLGQIDRDRYPTRTGGQIWFGEPTLEFEQRYSVALAEVNELEAELLALTGPKRSMLRSVGDQALAPDRAEAPQAKTSVDEEIF